jgi:hypothetical protein
MSIENQLGVALLAVLGALLCRRFGLPKRLGSVIPLLLSFLIVWAFGGLGSFREIAISGVTSGLFASGIIYILLGLLSRQPPGSRGV